MRESEQFNVLKLKFPPPTQGNYERSLILTKTCSMWIVKLPHVNVHVYIVVNIEMQLDAAYIIKCASQIMGTERKHSTGFLLYQKG